MREEELCSLNNYHISPFPLSFVIVTVTHGRGILAFGRYTKQRFHLAPWALNAFRRVPELHDERNRRSVRPVLQRAGGCPAREMHAIAIKLAWVIALTWCSRDMGSVHLEGKNTEKSRGYKDYLKSKGLDVVSLPYYGESTSVVIRNRRICLFWTSCTGQCTTVRKSWGRCMRFRWIKRYKLPLWAAPRSPKWY